MNGVENGCGRYLRQHQSQWHQLWSLISGISKPKHNQHDIYIYEWRKEEEEEEEEYVHVTLITGTNIQQVTAFVHTLRNLWRLLETNKHHQ